MTIASEITRLQWAKADIKTSIENKGVTVPSSASIDEYSWYIDQIQSWDVPPISITGEKVYWGMYCAGTNGQDTYGLDNTCVSYCTDTIVLIWYMWNRRTSNNYPQKDIHFVRWKDWVSGIKEWKAEIGSSYTQGCNAGDLYLTKESDDSYLFTANAYYVMPNETHRNFVAQIRYTVSTDSFTIVQSWSWSATATQNDMGLFTPSYDLYSDLCRASIFTPNV